MLECRRRLTATTTAAADGHHEPMRATLANLHAHDDELPRAQAHRTRTSMRPHITAHGRGKAPERLDPGAMGLGLGARCRRPAAGLSAAPRRLAEAGVSGRPGSSAKPRPVQGGPRREGNSKTSKPPGVLGCALRRVRTAKRASCRDSEKAGFSRAERRAAGTCPSLRSAGAGGDHSLRRAGDPSLRRAGGL